MSKFKDYLITFSTPEGERVLKDLKKQTIDNVVGSFDANAPSLHMALAHLEGQRATVKNILERIEIARKEK